MSVPFLSSLVHAFCIETADLLPVVVLLEEEALALLATCASGSAFVFTVSNSLHVVVRHSVDWVASAIASAAQASQVNLTVGRSVLIEVDSKITVVVAISAVAAEFWVHVAHVVSLWRRSRHWSDS